MPTVLLIEWRGNYFTLRMIGNCFQLYIQPITCDLIRDQSMPSGPFLPKKCASLTIFAHQNVIASRYVLRGHD